MATRLPSERAGARCGAKEGYGEVRHRTWQTSRGDAELERLGKAWARSAENPRGKLTEREDATLSRRWALQEKVEGIRASSRGPEYPRRSRDDLRLRGCRRRSG